MSKDAEDDLESLRAWVRKDLEDQEGWVWTSNIEDWLSPEVIAARRAEEAAIDAERDTWLCPIHGQAVIRNVQMTNFSGRTFPACPEPSCRMQWWHPNWRRY